MESIYFIIFYEQMELEFGGMVGKILWFPLEDGVSVKDSVLVCREGVYHSAYYTLTTQGQF